MGAAVVRHGDVRNGVRRVDGQRIGDGEAVIFVEDYGADVGLFAVGLGEGTREREG